MSMTTENLRAALQNWGNLKDAVYLPYREQTPYYPPAPLPWYVTLDPLYRLLMIGGAVGLLLWLFGSLANAQEIQRSCDNRYVFSHAVATGPVVVVAGVAGQSLYFCGFIIAQASQSLGFQVTHGKGANCSTGTIPLTPMFETPSNFAMSTRIAATPPTPNSDGNSLCIQTTGTGKLSGILFYTQF